MGFFLALLGGLALAGLAILDSYLGNPSAPVWSLPLLGLLFCAGLVLAR